jgi:hypothetical protein
LLEITTENHRDSPKRAVIVEQITESSFQRLYGIAMLHASFVPDNENSPSKKVCSLTVFRNIAERFCI